MLAAQKEAENRELQAKLHQERMDSTFQRDMLQYLIQSNKGIAVEIDDNLLGTRDEDSDSEESSQGSTTLPSPVDRSAPSLNPLHYSLVVISIFL